MATTALDVVSVERMLRELGLETSLADTNDPDYDADEVARLEGHIGAAVARVSRMVGFELLAKTVTVRVPRPEDGNEKLYISLPDFIRWTMASYYEDVYDQPITRTLQNAGMNRAGYPPTFGKGLAARSDRILDIEVWPNGLADEATRQWPTMAEESHLELTAECGIDPIPGDLQQAVVLVARHFYDGLERDRADDAARALCRPYQDWFLPDF